MIVHGYFQLVQNKDRVFLTLSLISKQSYTWKSSISTSILIKNDAFLTNSTTKKALISQYRFKKTNLPCKKGFCSQKNSSFSVFEKI
jgi:hypothetical protein